MTSRLRNSLATIAMLAGAMFASTAGAQEAKKLDPMPEPPALMQTLVKGGMKVETAFEAGSQLTGWILSAGPGQTLAAYSTPDNERVLVGQLMDAKGVNLTNLHMEQFAPKIDLAKLWPEVEKSAYVVEGANDKNAKATLYIFKDANCGYCHQVWSNLQPHMKDVQVRWIPVAFLADDSKNKAAAIFDAKDPAKLIAQLHAEWGKTSTLSKTPVSADVRKKLEANKILMGALGIRGTPAIVYKDNAGVVKLVDGSPAPQVLAEIISSSQKK